MTEILLFLGGMAVGAVLAILIIRRGSTLNAELQAMLAPVQTTLAQLREHNHILEKNRTESYGELRTLVQTLKDGQQSLQRETGRLAQRLYNPQTRGRWGEMQLQNIIERAGLKSYCDFSVQAGIEGGARRPDVVVNLPGGASIAIDAKTPMDAYDAIVDAADDAALAMARVGHAQHIRRHVEELSRKAYWEALPSPELVVLFLPGDHLLHSALESDATLLDTALAKNVLIATPATLLALLKAIAYGWRQEKMAKDAEKIGELGRTLYDRMGTLVDYMKKLGNNLASAMNSYNQAIGALDTRVLPAARKFEDYGVSGPKTLDIEPIDEVAPRQLQSPEMQAANDRKIAS